jgi:hypothetical protein
LGEEGGANLYAFVGNNPINGVDPFGLQSYWGNVWNDFLMTNKAIRGVTLPSLFPGLGLNALFTGYMAEILGTITPMHWFLSGLSGATLSGATFTGLETGVLAFATSGMMFFIGSLAYETGVFIGSMAAEMPVYGTNQTMTDWYVDMWWNLFHPKPRPCP